MIETCTREQLNDREKYWVQQLKCAAPYGYNLTSGGGQAEFTEEVMEKLRNYQRNRTPDHKANHAAAARRPETRAKVSAAGKGRKASPATIEKLKAIMRDRIVSDEARANMSKSAKIRAATPEYKERMSKLHKGKKLTDEHKAKLSAALSNPSPETREKLSRAASNRKHSPETLAKMRADRASPEWSAMCATGAKGKKQSPEQIRKRVESTRATKLRKQLELLGNV